MGTAPRQHHYRFVHRLLPQVARSNPVAFCGAMLSEDHEKILKEWWDGVGSDLPATDRLPWPSISVAPSQVGSHFIILFTFPPPAGTTEAYFSAFTLGPIAGTSADELKAAPHKYYVLEQGFSLDGTPRTVFAEWTSDGSHVNYGDGPPASAEAFLGHIKNVERLDKG